MTDMIADLRAKLESAERERDEYRARLAEIATYTMVIPSSADAPLCIETPLGFHRAGSEAEGGCDFCVIHEKARAAIKETKQDE